jgi:hypothetical protein
LLLPGFLDSELPVKVSGTIVTILKVRARIKEILLASSGALR